MAFNLGAVPIFTKLFGASPTKAGLELRDNFTDEDKQLVLLYFKWLTKKNAKNVGITQLALSGTMKPGIKLFLEREGLSNVTDWEFTGMVDYGIQGAVQCSHGGHNLRYAYFAYSPSTNRELIFGSNCASDFFDVDTATLTSFVKVIDRASRELCAILNKGRYSREFTFTDEAVNCFKLLARGDTVADAGIKQIYDDIAMRCYTYIGKTAMELWANFISRGLLLPKALKEICVTGYQQAAIDVLKSHPEYLTSLGYYMQLREKENFSTDPNLIKGEFIPPIATLSLTDALRVCMLEEIISPTSIANRFELLGLYNSLSEIEGYCKDYHFRHSRAEIFVRQLSKNGDKDMTDPLSCMLVSLIRNDLRIATFMFGLTQGTLHHIDITSPKTWLDSRIEFGDMNLFEEVWGSEEHWYGDLKRYVDARHPKRSLLVFLYSVLYPNIRASLSSSNKPQFYCASTEQEIADYPNDMQLEDIEKHSYDPNGDFAKTVLSGHTAYANTKIPEQFRGKYKSDDILPDKVPEDADFFTTKEDLDIANIVASLDLGLTDSEPRRIQYKGNKRRSTGKIDDYENEIYEEDGLDDEPEEIYEDLNEIDEGTEEIYEDLNEVDEGTEEVLEPEIEEEPIEEEPEIEEEVFDEDLEEDEFVEEEIYDDGDAYDEDSEEEFYDSDEDAEAPSDLSSLQAMLFNNLEGGENDE